MLTKEELLDAIRSIQEPSYKRSLTELNLVRDVMIKEGRIAMTVMVADPQLATSLEEEIRAVLGPMSESEVHVRMRQMTDFEKQEADKAAGLSTGDGSGQQRNGTTAQQHTHGLDLKSDILDPQSGVTFIAVASGKGGVGKSTVTVNLATALARSGKRVGIIDADIYGFSVPDMMGLEGRPQLKSENVIEPMERFGVKVMSMGFFVEDNAPIIWRGPMLGKMLRNFFSEVDWGELDYMLLDLPPGTGDIALDVHQMIPQSKEIIVTTPHATAAFVAARAGAMAVHTNHEILGVVENMAYYECSACGQKDYVFGKGGGAKLAEELHTDLLAHIPLGVPDNHPQEPDFSPSVYKADTAIGQIYNEIAEQIIRKTR
ncbi:MRP family ATP-binding protein [Xylanibacillus composti]|uniref:Iron-sulfur cluster carrier protein n=1 Tax=Xylanibacillus composti TaxID=1572762 RepID=A0A8J4H8T2_9BACL|nr:Mrp/NBP35 family ATP-binding protein [Xylanibacillus composti]MDT9727013.1 MRP family ATP-binding protein [Xylanibacillus composti]GIQ71229.1 iron-sulfur cluster carrier protein [Xylanibacillus composti]